MKKSSRWAELRRKVGLTQQQLANAVGVSLATVYRWERDGIQPKLDVLPALATALGTTVAALMSDVDDPTPARTGAVTQTVTNSAVIGGVHNSNTMTVATSPTPDVKPMPIAPWWIDTLTYAYNTADSGDRQRIADAAATVKTALDVLERAVATA